MIDLLADPNAWISLATLTALEIVLGIDNLIFIAILADRLPGRRPGPASARRGSRASPCCSSSPGWPASTRRCSASQAKRFHGAISC